MTTIPAPPALPGLWFRSGSRWYDAAAIHELRTALARKDPS